MTEKMLRAPEHRRKKSALPPTHTYSSFFFTGVVGMLKQDGHPNLYIPPTPLKKNLNTHPLANMKVKHVQQDRLVARIVLKRCLDERMALGHRDGKGP